MCGILRCDTLQSHVVAAVCYVLLKSPKATKVESTLSLWMPPWTAMRGIIHSLLRARTNEAIRPAPLHFIRAQSRGHQSAAMKGLP